ncbi:MAG: tripartite tricarboxylate transporter TctB family protein [Desulfobacteraceae bacterium]|nr:MAG: tripartite tricarboxylate transporter TctB family protein [Desulfobacteraceae bacterium]
MTGKGMPKADFIMGLLLMVFSFLIVVESLQLPRFEKDWGGFYAAPGFVPLILGVALFGMSLALFVRSLKSHGYKIIPDRPAIRDFLRSKPVYRWCLAILYAFGFFFLLGHIYFYVAAFLVLFAYMASFGEQKLAISMVISAVASALIYLVFTEVFLVPLP